MKVLLIIKRFDFGGAENHVCDLANALNDLGHQVFLIAANGRQLSRLNDEVQFIPIRLNDFLLPIQLFRIYTIINHHGIEIINAHQRLPILASCIISKICRIPVVATIHGRTRFDLKSNFCKKTATKIIFVSNRVLQVSDCYSEIKDKSVIIPSGIPIVDFSGHRHPFSIVYASRLDKKHTKLIFMVMKQIVPLLLKDFPELKFSFIGDGEKMKKIAKEASKINTAAKREILQILGFQSDIKTIIVNSGLVLATGRVAIEALSCGVAVLSVNSKRLGTIVTSDNFENYSKNNFVNVENGKPTPLELYAQLHEFLSNHKKYLEQTAEIKELIKSKYNIVNTTNETVKLYNETLLVN